MRAWSALLSLLWIVPHSAAVLDLSNRSRSPTVCMPWCAILGAVVNAQREADRVMRELAAQQFDANRNLLKEKAAGTSPVFADRLVNSQENVDLGGIRVELKHFGPAHTPGDLTVWIPDRRAVFSGDIVYTERLLAVIPIGNTGNWVKASRRWPRTSPA